MHSFKTGIFYSSQKKLQLYTRTCEYQLHMCIYIYINTHTRIPTNYDRCLSPSVCTYVYTYAYTYIDYYGHTSLSICVHMQVGTLGLLLDFGILINMDN